MSTGQYERTMKALNILGKWRVLLTGWQLGTRPTGGAVLDAPEGTACAPRLGVTWSSNGSSLLREEAAPAASGTAGAAPETAAELAAWIEWDTRARRGADQ